MDFDENSSFVSSLYDYYDEYVLQWYADWYKVAGKLEEFNAVSRVVTPCIISFLLIIGLVGNGLVIYVSVTTQRIIKHPIHSRLVLNLAVADILYLLASAPYQAFMHTLPGWIYGSFFCPALHYLNIQTMAVSIFTMCSLAIMRFMALMMPFKVQRSFVTTSTQFACLLIIATVWVMGSLLAVPCGVFYRLHELVHDENETERTYECIWTGDSESAYNVAILVFTYAIPLLLVAFLYFFIGKFLCNIISNKTATQIKRKGEKSDYLRTTIMVFFLIITFLVCWFPYHLFSMMMASGNYKHHSYAITRSVLELVGYCVSYVHACINPIIYTFAVVGFRKSVYLCFSCRKHSPKTRVWRTEFRRRDCCSYTSGRSSRANVFNNNNDGCRTFRLNSWSVTAATSGKTQTDNATAITITNV